MLKTNETCLLELEHTIDWATGLSVKSISGVTLSDDIIHDYTWYA